MGKKICFSAIFDGVLQAFLLHFLFELSMSVHLGEHAVIIEIFLRIVSTVLSVGFFCSIVKAESKIPKKFVALVLSVAALIFYYKIVVDGSMHVFDFLEYRSVEYRGEAMLEIFKMVFYPALHIIIRIAAAIIVIFNSIIDREKITKAENEEPEHNEAVYGETEKLYYTESVN